MIKRATVTDEAVHGLISHKRPRHIVMNTRERRWFDAVVWSASMMFTVLLFDRAHDDSHRRSGDSLVQVAAASSESGGASQTGGVP